ncbi:MAG: hypothetical protein BWX64_01831 [Acidobacteria bacterium ADurb.Bin051]|nr:MAG: hypothetical protein BWX64_01831 [Acidobacteria bacterium ADurb.Bin051]
MIEDDGPAGRLGEGEDEVGEDVFEGERFACVRGERQGFDATLGSLLGGRELHGKEREGEWVGGAGVSLVRLHRFEDPDLWGAVPFLHLGEDGDGSGSVGHLAGGGSRVVAEGGEEGG